MTPSTPRASRSLMNIKPIRTPADHAAALKEVERLWDGAKPGTPDGDKFEVLSTLADAYEREHMAIPTPDPIEAIRFRMEQQGLTPTELVAIFKTRARASEIMTKKRRLNLRMIREDRTSKEHISERTTRRRRLE